MNEKDNEVTSETREEVPKLGGKLKLIENKMKTREIVTKEKEEDS